MCDPITLAVLAAGTVASVAGTGIQARESIDQQRRAVAARNKVLQETQAKNLKIANDSRDIFNKRVSEIDGQVEPQLQISQDARTEGIVGNLAEPSADEIADIVGDDAPIVVKSDLAKKMAEQFQRSTENAKALGKLTGYTGFFNDQSISDQVAGRGVGVNANSIAGNVAMLPYLQDFAEIESYKPSSGLGALLSAIGGTTAQYAGAKGMTLGKKAAAQGPLSIVPQGFYRA